MKLLEELKEEPTLSELIELARQEREALLAKRGGGKGSARIKLERKREELSQMLLKEQLPVAVIRDLLARTGTEVNLKSLFKYLREEMAEEYAEYLRVTQRGKRENRSQSIRPEMSRAEQESVDRFHKEAPTDLVGRGNQKEETATPNAPAATGEATTQEAGIDPATLDMSKFYR